MPSQLEAIVQRMIDANEPEENIADVIRQYSFTGPPAPPSPELPGMNQADIPGPPSIPQVGWGGKPTSPTSEQLRTHPSSNTSPTTFAGGVLNSMMSGEAQKAGIQGGMGFAKGATYDMIPAIGGALSDLGESISDPMRTIQGGIDIATNPLETGRGVINPIIEATKQSGSHPFEFGEMMGQTTGMPLVGEMGALNALKTARLGMRGGGGALSKIGGLMEEHQPLSGFIPRIAESRTIRNIERVTGKGVQAIGNKVKEWGAKPVPEVPVPEVQGEIVPEMQSPWKEAEYYKPGPPIAPLSRQLSAGEPTTYGGPPIQPERALPPATDFGDPTRPFSVTGDIQNPSMIPPAGASMAGSSDFFSPTTPMQTPSPMLNRMIEMMRSGIEPARIVSPEEATTARPFGGGSVISDPAGYNRATGPAPSIPNPPTPRAPTTLPSRGTQFNLGEQTLQPGQNLNLMQQGPASSPMSNEALIKGMQNPATRIDPVTGQVGENIPPAVDPIVPLSKSGQVPSGQTPKTLTELLREITTTQERPASTQQPVFTVRKEVATPEFIAAKEADGWTNLGTDSQGNTRLQRAAGTEGTRQTTVTNRPSEGKEMSPKKKVNEPPLENEEVPISKLAEDVFSKSPEQDYLTRLAEAKTKPPKRMFSPEGEEKFINDTFGNRENYEQFKKSVDAQTTEIRGKDSEFDRVMNLSDEAAAREYEALMRPYRKVNDLLGNPEDEFAKSTAAFEGLTEKLNLPKPPNRETGLTKISESVKEGPRESSVTNKPKPSEGKETNKKTMYHGTQKEIEKFDTKHVGEGEFPNMIHFSEDPVYSDMYARGHFSGGPKSSAQQSFIYSNAEGVEKATARGHAPNMIAGVPEMKRPFDFTKPISPEDNAIIAKALGNEDWSIEDLNYELNMDPELVKKLPFDGYGYETHGIKNWAIPHGTPIKTPWGTPLTKGLKSISESIKKSKKE